MCLGDKDKQNTVSAGDIFNGELMSKDWVRIMVEELIESAVLRTGFDNLRNI